MWVGLKHILKVKQEFHTTKGIAAWIAFQIWYRE